MASISSFSRQGTERLPTRIGQDTCLKVVDHNGQEYFGQHNKEASLRSSAPDGATSVSSCLAFHSPVKHGLVSRCEFFGGGMERVKGEGRIFTPSLGILNIFVIVMYTDRYNTL